MYKINSTREISPISSNTLLSQDIHKMHLLPPHCPLYPNGYNQFYNDNDKLQPVVPYKIIEVKHPKDGKKIQRLEYNNFYSDWKQNALKWYPQTTEYETINDTCGYSGRGTVPGIMLDDKLCLYEETKRKDQFAKPLATNGTNQLNIIFNDKCAITTFNYKRYASSGINNTKWFDNPIYKEDISQETQEQKAQYMDNTIQNGMDIYSSVFEDMYLLGYSPNNIPDTNTLNTIRKSY